MLHLHSSVGIARELTERLYDKPSRKIREVVTNALDAGASEITVTFDPADGGKLVFTDNGCGMSTSDFEDSFLRIGGSPKRTDPAKIGRIGVGFLAATFGTKLRVYSRASGEAPFCAELLIGKIFNDENWDKDVQDLDLGDYAPFNPNELPMFPTFTRLELIGLHEHVLPYFQDRNKRAELQEDLRRILPIRYPEKSPLLSFLAESPDYANLLSFLRSSELRAISVDFLGTKLTRRVYGEKAGETIVAVRELPHARVEGATVWGYVVDAGKAVPKDWEGLTSRVKNVAVETSGWLGYEKGGRTQKARVTGELFVAGLKDNSGALNIDRSQLQRSHPQVIAISEYLRTTITSFLTEVNARKQKENEKGTLVNLGKLGDISHLPSQPKKALESLTGFIKERLVPAADQAKTLSDIRTVSQEALRLLGYSQDETKDAGEGLLSVVNPDGEPAFVLRMGVTEHRTDRHEVFNAMDRLGVTVGVVAKKKHWEVWWGTGADKQQIAKVNLGSLTEESLAGLWFISKKVRWMEGRLRKFQDPTMVLSAFQVLGAMVSSPKLSADGLAARLLNEGLTPEVSGSDIVWYEPVDVSAGTLQWFQLDNETIRARVQVQFDSQSGKAIILTAERSVLQAILHWLRAEYQAHVWPLQDSLMGRSGVEVISYARTVEDQVVTYSLREPLPLQEVHADDVLGWTVGIDGRYMTVFQNNWMAVPLYAPDEMALLSRMLFSLGGSRNG